MLARFHLLASRRKMFLTAFFSLILAILLFSMTPSIGSVYLSAAQRPVVVTLPPAGSVSVVVDGFCLDYSLPFPGPEITPGSLAPPEIRLAIAHSVANGYTQSDPYQVQLAIWYLRDGKWYEADHDLAAEIVDYAQSGAEPPDTDLEGMLLPEAVSSGTISATVTDFHAVSTPAYKGRGSLELVNLTDSEQVIGFPYGTVFEADPSLGVQNMVVYAVEEAPTPTPTSSPTATSTPRPATPTPTSSPTATPVPPTPTPTEEPVLPPSGAPQASRTGWARGMLMVGGVLIAGGLLLLRRARSSTER